MPDPALIENPDRQLDAVCFDIEVRDRMARALDAELPPIGLQGLVVTGREAAGIGQQVGQETTEVDLAGAHSTRCDAEGLIDQLSGESKLRHPVARRPHAAKAVQQDRHHRRTNDLRIRLGNLATKPRAVSLIPRWKLFEISGCLFLFDGNVRHTHEPRSRRGHLQVSLLHFVVIDQDVNRLRPKIIRQPLTYDSLGPHAAVIEFGLIAMGNNGSIHA